MFDGLRLGPVRAEANPERSVFDGINLPAQPSAPQRGRFDGLQLGDGTQPAPDRATQLGEAVQRYARAVAEMDRMTDARLPVLEHQQRAHDVAAKELDTIQRDGASDLAAAFAREPALVSEAANERTLRWPTALQRIVVSILNSAIFRAACNLAVGSG